MRERDKERHSLGRDKRSDTVVKSDLSLFDVSLVATRILGYLLRVTVL